MPQLAKTLNDSSDDIGIYQITKGNNAIKMTTPQKLFDLLTGSAGIPYPSPEEIAEAVPLFDELSAEREHNAVNELTSLEETYLRDEEDGAAESEFMDFGSDIDVIYWYDTEFENGHFAAKFAAKFCNGESDIVTVENDDTSIIIISSKSRFASLAKWLESSRSWV